MVLSPSLQLPGEENLLCELLLGHDQSLPGGLTLFPAVQLGHGVGGGSMGSTVEQFMISVRYKAGHNCCIVFTVGMGSGTRLFLLCDLVPTDL